MLQILNNKITMLDGLYSLNDLHKASGGEYKHRPTFFLRLENTQHLITEIDNARCADMHIKEPVRVVRGIQADSTPQGTYVCRELVYSYTMWISPKFQLMVIRAFDLMANQQYRLTDRVNQLCNALGQLENGLSHAGRFLSIGGRQVKPELTQEIDQSLSKLQPSLFDFADEHTITDKGV